MCEWTAWLIDWPLCIYLPQVTGTEQLVTGTEQLVTGTEQLVTGEDKSET